MRVLVLCVLVGVMHTRAAPLSDIDEKLSSYYKQCSTESKVDESIVEKARNGIFQEDPAFKAYIYCLSQKIGLQNQDGEVQTEVFKKKLEPVVEDKVVFDKLVKECTVPKENPQETAFFVVRCVKEIFPSIEIFKVAPSIQEQKEKILAYRKECIKESKVEESLVQRAFKGIYSDAPELKNYMLCFSKKVGFQNQEGAVQRDVIEKKLGSIVEDKEIFDKLIKDCVVQKESPQETAFFIAKCMREVSPNLQLFKVDSFLTQEQKELRTKVLKKCQEETKVPTNVLENARKGDFQEEPLLKDYFFCINKQSNNLDESGFYKIDVVAEKMKKLFGQERGDKIIQKCIKNLENPLTTSFEALKCIYFEVPETSLAF